MLAVASVPWTTVRSTLRELLKALMDYNAQGPEQDDASMVFLEAMVQSIAENAASRDTSVYHAKVVQLKDALQLLCQKRDITLEPPETVIPYQQARAVILRNPESISVGECACRAAAEESCLGEGERDVCLFVGDPHAAFVREVNPKFRKISQKGAMALLEDAHAKGFVHCAYFKKDIGRRFVAICNCCSCCCQGMKAWNIFGGAIPLLAPSGYLCEIGEPEGVPSGGPDLGDYNPQAIEAFRTFVRKRYGNDLARLRGAYRVSAGCRA